jgi:hypothetical protein
MCFRTAWILLAVSAAGPVAAQTTEPNVIEWGIEQRTRAESSSNAYDFNGALPDNRTQIRYRTRAWVCVPLGSNVEAFAGLSHEAYQKIEPRLPWRLDEVVFESAYIDVRRVFVKGISLRVGRQEFEKGEGLIFSDGSPADGSRTSYFNAADLAYTHGASKVELIGISDPSTDRYLPRAHDQQRRLAEWNEQALGAYFTNHARRDTDFEAYYFYKKETGDYRAPTDPQYQPDRHVHTAGGRVAYRWADAWTAAGEFALERGRRHGGVEIAAWGGYLYLRRIFAAARKPYLQAGYWAFSGDDPRTPGRDEGFDPIFSRSPRWGNLLLYSMTRERGLSYWSNIGLWQAEFGFAPQARLKYRFTVYGLSAFHQFPGDPRTFGTGLGRGMYLQSRLDFAVSRHWKGHALWEYLAPGSFYSARTHGQFLRLEMIYLWTGKTEGSRSHT